MKVYRVKINNKVELLIKARQPDRAFGVSMEAMQNPLFPEQCRGIEEIQVELETIHERDMEDLLMFRDHQVFSLLELFQEAPEGSIIKITELKVVK